jgi:hypothetical protein
MAINDLKVSIELPYEEALRLACMAQFPVPVQAGDGAIRAKVVAAIARAEAQGTDKCSRCGGTGVIGEHDLELPEFDSCPDCDPDGEGWPGVRGGSSS